MENYSSYHLNVPIEKFNDLRSKIDHGYKLTDKGHIEETKEHFKLTK